MYCHMYKLCEPSGWQTTLPFLWSPKHINDAVELSPHPVSTYPWTDKMQKEKKKKKKLWQVNN